jgi:hypothetical protein
MTDVLASLLALPRELHLQILNDCRPDSFEALMLTCKQLYSTGFNLIQEHDFCKRWGPQKWPMKSYPMYKKEFVSTRSPLELFEGLLDAPPQHRPWLIYYLNAIHVESDYGLLRYDPEMRIMQRVSKEWPWLRTTLLEIMQSFPR